MKMHASTAENLRNLGAYWIMDIFLILRSAHMVPKDQDKWVFYINNYINQAQFNKLYDPELMKKGVQDADAITYKLRLALTKATNQKLEISGEEIQKKDEIVQKRKRKDRSQNSAELEGELVYLIQRRGIIKVTLEMKQIQTKPIMDIYSSSERQ